MHDCSIKIYFFLNTSETRIRFFLSNRNNCIGMVREIEKMNVLPSEFCKLVSL